MTSRPSWRSTSETWAALDVAAEDLVEEEEPVGADLADRLVSAGLIRWVESSSDGELHCMYQLCGTIKHRIIYHIGSQCDTSLHASLNFYYFLLHNDDHR